MKPLGRLQMRISVFVALGGHAVMATTYTITDLGLPYSGEPIAINNYGQVVGDTASIFGAASGYNGQAVVWQPSTANATTGALAYPITSAPISAAIGINSMGQIAGYSAASGSVVFSTYLFTPATPNATSGSTAIIPIVPPSNGNFELEGGINDIGEVAAAHGYPTTASSLFSPTTPNGSTGTATTLSGAFYVPGAISNTGQVVGALAGYGGTYQAGRFVPTVQNGTTGTYVDIADPGQGGTAFIGPGGAQSVNSVGDTAGNGSTALGQPPHALIWKATGQVIDLDSLLGGTGAGASGINDADQVVGQTAGSKAYIYAGGVVTDLNTLISDPNWTLQSAIAINNKGQIIGTGHHNGSAASFLLTPVVTTPPAPSQWISASSGDWNNASNWSAGTPNTAGAEADFVGAITTNQTVYTNIPVTAGTVSFNNSNSYVVTGSSTMTLLAASGTASISALQGTQEIDLPLYVASTAAFNAASGATLIIANPITVTSGNHLSTTGTVLFQSQITLQAGSSLSINGSNYASALTVGPLATMSITKHGTGPVSVLQLDNLSLTGTLDLANNALIVRNGNLTAVTALVQAAYNGSGGHPWAGVGITSSTAENDTTHLTALGVIANSQNGVQIYSNSNLFDGTGPGTSDILVNYTYYGDANLDGHVDGSDYTLIDLGYLTHLTGWYNGDFNYDGKVDGSDYTLIDNAFNKQGASLAAQFAGTAAVPEPATIAAMATIAAATLARRRR